MAQQLLKQRQWSAAMNKVDGKRVRDDPKLIRKVTNVRMMQMQMQMLV